MINPKYDEKSEHLTIFEIKTEYCLGFRAGRDGKTFYFMDDFKNVIKLERMKDS